MEEAKTEPAIKVEDGRPVSWSVERGQRMRGDIDRSGLILGMILLGLIIYAVSNRANEFDDCVIRQMEWDRSLLGTEAKDICRDIAEAKYGPGD